jgi:ABC-type lipopolysaccharide export system ATPase subunit
MKFNIGDIVEFNHLDEATRNYKKISGLLVDFEDNTVHSNYSVCIVLSGGEQLKIPMSKLLNSKMKIKKIEN